MEREKRWGVRQRGGRLKGRREKERRRQREGEKEGRERQTAKEEDLNLYT